mgnify:CR=1 FL=1
MEKQLKEKTVKNIKEKFDKSKVVILTEYKGLNMAQISGLRSKLRTVEAEYRIFKNTLVALATKEKAYDGLDKLLVGPTAILFGYKDQVLPAKVLSEFVKENEKLNIKGGILEGKLVDTKTISALSKLPSREALIAKVVGGVKAPITNLVFDLKGIINKLGFALNAIRDKKQS